MEKLLIDRLKESKENLDIFKNSLPIENWSSKYQFNHEKQIETFIRVAEGNAKAEKKEVRKYWANEFLKMMIRFVNDKPAGLKNTPGGRITANLGTTFDAATLINCFVTGPVARSRIKYKRSSQDEKFGHDITIKGADSPDDLINIFVTILEQAKTLASEGGYGINFDFIRPRGSIIEGIGIRHPGVVAYMKIWDAVSECIVTGDNDGYKDKIKNYLNDKQAKELEQAVKEMARKGAMNGSLSISHPDIEEFIRAKQESGVLTKFNISVAIDDDFMKAVLSNDFYELWFKGVDYKKASSGFYTRKLVKAKDLYDLIMESTYNRNEPGVIFVDNMHRNNPIAYLGKCTAVNPSLRKDSLVLTDKGIYKIKDLAEHYSNPKVLNYKGEWHKAKVFKSGKNKTLYKIKFNNNQKIYCTAEHKWPLLNKFNYKSNKVKNINGYDFNKKKTKDIKKGDKVLIPNFNFVGNKKSLLSKEEGLLVGWFLGDGWKTIRKDGRSQFGFLVTKEDASYGIKNKLEKLINKISITSKVSFTKKDSCYEVNASNKNMKSFFDKMGFVSKEEGIPKIVWESNIEFIKGFIDGLFSTDGCLSSYTDNRSKKEIHRLTLNSSRVKLISDVQKLLTFFGIQSRVNKRKLKNIKFPNGKDYNKEYIIYDLYITSFDIVSFHNIFKLSNKRKEKLIKNASSYIKKEHKNVDPRNFLTIKSVTKTNKKEDVYDITVDDDTHTFMTEVGITGNCGEVPGLLWLTTVCLLSSVNITQYIYIDEDGIPRFNWDGLRKDLFTLTRFLDNVNDLTYCPLQSYEWVVKKLRQLGIGINGLGSALLMLGIPYNSKEAVEFTKKVCDQKENYTWQASALLAEEKGTFPLYDKKEFENTSYFKSDRLWPETKRLIRKHGVRNAKTTTNPPLGNTSVITEVSNGIEPVFDLEYERIVISKEWPDGLTKDNIDSILRKRKKLDYEYWKGDYNGKTYYYEPHNRGLCVVEIVRDYGYQWLLNRFPDKDHSKYLITTKDLTVNDHLNIQQVVQYHCNQSVSKCLVKGQLVETDQGATRIEDFIKGDYKKIGFYKANKLKVYNQDGKLVEVNRAYYGGNKESFEIKTNQGELIRCSENHRFLTSEGWKKAKNLKNKDYLVSTNFKKYKHGKGNLDISFNMDEYNFHYYKNIKLPKTMNKDLAKFLGMIASDGTLSYPSVLLTTVDKHVEKVFDDLCIKLFNIKPNKVKDKRNRNINCVISSVPLLYYVVKLLKGSKSFDKRIPDQIMKGSLEEKTAFLEGLTLDGYYMDKKKKLCIYNGVSINLAKDVETICKQIDSRNTNFISKRVKGYNCTYGVYVGFNLVTPIERHKRKKVTSKKSYVLIDTKDLDKFTYSRKQKNYNAIMGLKIRKSNILYQNSAEKFKLKFKFLSKVTNIKPIGKKEVFDIELKTKDHTYLVSNIITHNTSNLPKNYKYDDFKNLYIDAWKRGLNGFTTYREGTMETVISSIEEDHDIIKKDIKLPPTFINGPTTVTKKEGMKFYIHFSYLPDDHEMKHPFVLWIYSNSKEKGYEKICNAASRQMTKLALKFGISKSIVTKTMKEANTDYPYNRLGRTISLNLRHNIPRTEIIKELHDVEDDNVSTLLFAVRKMLAKTIKDGTKVSGVKCEGKCKGENVIMEGGCIRCRDCGWTLCD